MKMQDIKVLEGIIEQEKERIKEEEVKEYEAGPHPVFEIGQWVTDGQKVGVVQNIWDDCYINVTIISGGSGTICQTRANNYRLLQDPALSYYTTEKELSFFLTGSDIESLLGGMHRNVNPSEAKTKLLDALEELSMNHITGH